MSIRSLIDDDVSTQLQHQVSCLCSGSAGDRQPPTVDGVDTVSITGVRGVYSSTNKMVLLSCMAYIELTSRDITAALIGRTGNTLLKNAT